MQAGPSPLSPCCWVARMYDQIGVSRSPGSQFLEGHIFFLLLFHVLIDPLRYFFFKNHRSVFLSPQDQCRLYNRPGDTLVKTWPKLPWRKMGTSSHTQHCQVVNTVSKAKPAKSATCAKQSVQSQMFTVLVQKSLLAVYIA